MGRPCFPELMQLQGGHAQRSGDPVPCGSGVGALLCCFTLKNNIRGVIKSCRDPWVQQTRLPS